jgi:hypothetical protein
MSFKPLPEKLLSEFPGQDRDETLPYPIPKAKFDLAGWQAE